MFINNKKLVIYGAGGIGEKFLYKCNVLGLNVEYFIDRNKLGYCFNKKIYKFENVPKLQDIYIVVACDEKYYYEIKQLLKKAGKIEFVDFCHYLMIDRLGNLKKLCLVNMNCYIYPVKEYLNYSEYFKSTYFLYPIEPIYCRKKDEIDEVLLKTTDVYIHQIIGEKGGNFNSSDSFCIPRLKANCTIITMPNFYPDGAKIFYPFLVKEFECGYFYEDSYIELALKKFIEPEKILNFINSININKENFKDIDEWFEWLEYRDMRYSIKVSQYIKANYKNVKLFNDMGHPSSNLMLFICSELAKILKIKDIPQAIFLTEIGYEHFVWKPVMDAFQLNFKQNCIRANKNTTRLMEDESCGITPIEFIREYSFVRKNMEDEKKL